MDSNNIVTNIAAGGEFSIFVTRNKLNNETELFGCGHNLRGQIGASFVRHVTDLVKIDGLSNYRIQVFLLKLYRLLMGNIKMWKQRK